MIFKTSCSSEFSKEGGARCHRNDYWAGPQLSGKMRMRSQSFVLSAPQQTFWKLEGILHSSPPASLAVPPQKALWTLPWVLTALHHPSQVASALSQMTAPVSLFPVPQPQPHTGPGCPFRHRTQVACTAHRWREALRSETLREGHTKATE